MLDARLLVEASAAVLRLVGLRVLLGAALGTALLLVGLTTLEWSGAAWGDWFWKVAKLSADPHGNSVALRGIFRAAGG